jgi:DNA-binding response OmpR family regulator
MSSRTSEGRDSETGRLGGARADFVASLGRKVADARDLLSAIEDDPTSKVIRDELRRRLHALGSGARLLRFEAMARALQQALVVLEQATQAGSLREAEVAFVGQTLDELRGLAWGDAAPPQAPVHAHDDPDEAPGHPPITVLVVGDEDLADALMDDGIARIRAFECERTADLDTALQLARAYAPDLVLVDADLARATDLVAALLDDPLTEPVPIIVVGTFRIADDAARFVALGVAKSLAKPVAPELIRATCDEILDSREGRTLRVTLGEPTLEQLADRLADELKRALVDSVDRSARSLRVPLGEGTEVLGALWGAIARIQEIVAQRTGGAIQFDGGAPEGSIAVAPWLHHETPADRGTGRGRGAAADVRLKGRRVVVADDDPGVTWFISDLLRTAGCEVHEALDGRTALDLAFRVQPELVVSDILMPGLDGFALSRAIRRDVALRDTPVILLSWKEDLLQRVRELGASAAAYMRKESDSRAVLARVREVLRPRARIEMRLRGEGEARGRLDGLSPRLLLDLVCVVRKDARVSVRDAMFLYEIEIRGGAPRKITRTASDGSYQSGERALASLLGVGSGRFAVATTHDPIRGDLTGSLIEQLARPIAAARGALAATTGATTIQVERITIDDAVLGEYLRATPEPARALIQRLSSGASPRQMLLAGDASPVLLEDVLADLAARGAIRSVEGYDGADLLTPAVDEALAVLRGSARRFTLPPNARPSAPVPVGAFGRKPAGPPPAPRAPPPPAPLAPVASSSASTIGEPAADPFPSPLPFALHGGSTSREPPPDASDEDADAPSSLEDAVIREISERSPEPGLVHSGNALRSIVEASDLRPRSSDPPANHDEDAEVRALPSVPPDAMVPETSAESAASSSEFGSIERTAKLPMPVDREGRPPEGPASPSGAERSSADGAAEAYVEPLAVADEPGKSDLQATAAAEDALPRPAPKGDPRTAHAQGASVRPEPLGVEPRDPMGIEPRSRRAQVGGFVVALIVLGAAVAVILYVDSREAERPRSHTPALTASAAPAIPIPTASTARDRPAIDDLPPGAEVPAGYGFLEAFVPAGAPVQVDGARVGTGPQIGSPLIPGYHELKVEQAGRTSTQVVEVRAGKTTRVHVALP